MQSINYKVNEKSVILLVDSSKAPLISKEHCKKLIPYIEKQFNDTLDYELEEGIIKLNMDSRQIQDLCYNQPCRSFYPLLAHFETCKTF